ARSSLVEIVSLDAVRRELKVTDAQARDLDRARDDWDATTRQPGKSTAKERRTRLDEANAAFEKALARVLRPEQSKRLAQSRLQDRLGGPTDLTLFTLPEVVAGLKLTAADQEKLSALRDQRRQDMAALLLSGQPADRLTEQAAEHNRETFEKMRGMLDDDRKQ